MVMSPGTHHLLDMDIKFNDLVVSHEEDDKPLLTGHGLELSVMASGDLFLIEKGTEETKSLSLDIEGLIVPDLALFQRYLPEKWPFRLYGGNGSLHGSVSVSTDAADIDLYINSDAADMGTDRYRFTTNLDAGLRISNPALRTSPTLVNGTYIKLLDASLKRDVEVSFMHATKSCISWLRLLMAKRTLISSGPGLSLMSITYLSRTGS